MVALPRRPHGVLKIVEAPWGRGNKSTLYDLKQRRGSAAGSPWDRIERDRTPRDGVCFEHAQSAPRINDGMGHTKYYSLRT